MNKLANRIVFLIMGFIAGLLFSGIVISISSGNMMLKEMKSPFDFNKTVETIENKINNKEGWHVVQTIDQQYEIEKYTSKKIAKIKIIQYCNANFSQQMLNSDSRLKMGSMMPKTFAVYEKTNGGVYVSTANGAIMGKLFDSETETIIEKVSLEVEDILSFMNFKFNVF